MRNTEETKILANSRYHTGIYKLFDNKIVLIRNGYSIDSIEDYKEEFLLLSVSEDREITPESEIARIQKKSTLLSVDLLPSQDAIRIINIFKRN
jgi:hypothetical protein